MQRTQLLGLLVKHAAEATGKSVAEMTELLGDEHGSVDILDQLGIDYGVFSRIIDGVERELDIVLPIELLVSDSTRDNLLNAMELAVGGDGSGGVVSPEQAGNQGGSIAEAIGAGLMRSQIADPLL